MSNESKQHWLDRNRPPRVQITYDVETLGSSVKVELPLVVGILADLKGDSDNTEPTDKLKTRKFVQIDRDNFDDLMGQLKPRLKLGGQAGQSGLTFTRLEDFHPLQVIKQTPRLNKLLRERQQLVDLVAKLSGNDTLNAAFQDVFNKNPRILEQKKQQAEKREAAERQKIQDRADGLGRFIQAASDVLNDIQGIFSGLTGIEGVAQADAAKIKDRLALPDTVQDADKQVLADKIATRATSWGGTFAELAQAHDKAKADYEQAAGNAAQDDKAKKLQSLQEAQAALLRARLKSTQEKSSLDEALADCAFKSLAQPFTKAGQSMGKLFTIIEALYTQARQEEATANRRAQNAEFRSLEEALKKAKAAKVATSRVQGVWGSARTSDQAIKDLNLLVGNFQDGDPLKAGVILPQYERASLTLLEAIKTAGEVRSGLLSSLSK